MKYLVFIKFQDEKLEQERVDIKIIQSYLPEYSELVNIPELPNWIVYQKSNPEVNLDEKQKN